MLHSLPPRARPVAIVCGGEGEAAADTSDPTRTRLEDAALVVAARARVRGGSPDDRARPHAMGAVVSRRRRGGAARARARRRRDDAALDTGASESRRAGE